jgi:nicotinamidase/pyrazinamidase
MNPQIDSYSAFFENDRTTATGLGAYLTAKGITRVVVVGLAYDFCVGYTALDARALGFAATVVTDLTRAIGMPLERGTTVDAIERKFEARGVVRTSSAALWVPEGAEPTPEAAPTAPRRPRSMGPTRG